MYPCGIRIEAKNDSVCLMQTGSQEIPKDEFPISLVALEKAVSRFQPHAAPHLVKGRVVTRLAVGLSH